MQNLIVVCFIVAFANISMALPRSMPAESEYNEKSCPRRCSEQYNPICGVNEAGDNCVFVNDCYMAIENCNAAAEKVYRPAVSEKCPEYSSWVDKDWKQNESENQV